MTTLKQRSFLHMAYFPALPRSRNIHVDSIEGARKGLSSLPSRPGIICIEKSTSIKIPLTEELRRLLVQLVLSFRASSAFDPSCLHLSTGRYT